MSDEHLEQCNRLTESGRRLWRRCGGGHVTSVFLLVTRIVTLADVSARQTIARTAIVVAVLLTSAMWLYAFVFASREAVNKIEDSSWQQRAERLCAAALLERLALADFRLIEDAGPDALAERAAIVDEATDILEEMVRDIASVSPKDDKGRALVPQWLADYTTYLQDRREYANLLRSGVNEPFSETMTEGLPLSEKISTFAADNLAPSCKPPIDLSV